MTLHDIHKLKKIGLTPAEINAGRLADRGRVGPWYQFYMAQQGAAQRRGLTLHAMGVSVPKGVDVSKD